MSKKEAPKNALATLKDQIVHSVHKTEQTNNHLISNFKTSISKEYTFQKSNFKSRELKRQLAGVKSVATAMNLEGIFKLDAFSENQLQIQMNQIRDFEDEIARLTREIVGLNCKFDSATTLEAEKNNRDTRLMIKRIQFKQSQLEEQNNNLKKEVELLVGEKIDELYNFDNMGKVLTKNLKIKAGPIFENIDQEFADQMNFDITSHTNDNGAMVGVGEVRNKGGVKQKVIKHKRLNDLEKETLGMEVDVLLGENINFQVMARSKSLNKGNTIDGLRYDAEELNAKEHREHVLEELSSISSIDKPRNKKRRNKDRGNSQDSSSSYNSNASRINFWRKYNKEIDPLEFDIEFNQLDHLYLEKNGVKNVNRGGGGAGKNTKSGKQQRMIGDDEFRLKMDKLKSVFEIQKTKNQSTIMDEAGQMVREQCRGVCKAFKNETVRLVQQYHNLRQDTIQANKKVQICFDVVINQEYIINELRGFIEENLMTFLDVIEREKENVITKYKTLNEKLQQKMDFKDPFTIFELYNSTVQLENNTSKKDSHIYKLEEEIKQLKLQNEELQITSSMTLQVANLLSEDKQLQAEKIVQLKTDYRNLEIALTKQKTKDRREQQRLQAIIEDQKFNYTRERKNLMSFSKAELACANAVSEKLKKDIAVQEEEVKGIKAVLRIPRLYNIYVDAMKAVNKPEVMDCFITKQLDLLAEDKDGAPTEEQYKRAVTSALNLGLGAKYPVEQLYDYAIQNQKQGNADKVLAPRSYCTSTIDMSSVPGSQKRKMYQPVPTQDETMNFSYIMSSISNTHTAESGPRTITQQSPQNLSQPDHSQEKSIEDEEQIQTPKLQQSPSVNQWETQNHSKQQEASICMINDEEAKQSQQNQNMVIVNEGSFKSLIFDKQDGRKMDKVDQLSHQYILKSQKQAKYHNQAKKPNKDLQDIESYTNGNLENYRRLQASQRNGRNDNQSPIHVKKVLNTFRKTEISNPITRNVSSICRRERVFSADNMKIGPPDEILNSFTNIHRSNAGKNSIITTHNKSKQMIEVSVPNNIRLNNNQSGSFQVAHDHIKISQLMNSTSNFSSLDQSKKRIDNLAQKRQPYTIGYNIEHHMNGARPKTGAAPNASVKRGLSSPQNRQGHNFQSQNKQSFMQQRLASNNHKSGWTHSRNLAEELQNIDRMTSTKASGHTKGIGIYNKSSTKHML